MDSVGEEIRPTSTVRKRTRLEVRKLVHKLECQFVSCFDDDQYDLHWLRQEIELNAEGWVTLDTLLKKNNVQENNINPILLKILVNESKFLELNDNFTHIRLNKTNKSFENCVIFVDKIPKEADANWIREAFSRFGCIMNIKIPKPKTSSNRKNKGFCFVRFSNPTSAQNALNNFDEKLSKNAKKLLSPKKKSIENSAQVEKTVTEEEPPAKKMRLDEKLVAKINPKLKKNRRKQNKNRKLRHRKNREQYKQMVKDLVVHSWTDWSQLKSDYLTKQKNNYSVLKRQLKEVSNKEKIAPNSANHKRKRGREKLADKAAVALENSIITTETV